MNVCDIFLFAAGLGTRLRPFTEKHPKPVLPLHSYPLGYYPLPYIQTLKINKFIVNTFHLAPQVHELYKKTSMNPVFSDESGFIKGSAGGLKQAEGLLSKNPILAVNADEVLFTEKINFLTEALDFHQQNNHLATLIVKEHPGVGKEFGGIWCDGQTVKDIGKKEAPAGLKGWHFIGFQFLSPEILKTLPSGKEANIFYDYLINHLNTGRVKIFPIQGDWYETGNLDDYKKAKSAIADNLKTKKMYQTFFDKMQTLPKSTLSDLT